MPMRASLVNTLHRLQSQKAQGYLPIQCYTPPHCNTKPDSCSRHATDASHCLEQGSRRLVEFWTPDIFLVLSVAPRFREGVNPCRITILDLSQTTRLRDTSHQHWTYGQASSISVVGLLCCRCQPFVLLILDSFLMQALRFADHRIG